MVQRPRDPRLLRYPAGPIPVVRSAPTTGA